MGQIFDRRNRVIRPPQFTPRRLFRSAEAGAVYDITDLSTLFQDSAGTTSVTAASQPVGLALDVSGNGSDLSQAIAAARPTYLTGPSRLDLNSIDDNMTVDFGAAFTGTVMQGTPRGVLHYDISAPTGVWNLTVNPLRVPDGGEITGLVAVGRALTDTEVARTEQYLQRKGAGTDFTGVTNMAQWFQARTDVTDIHAANWNTAAVTTFYAFAYTCTSLTTLDVSGWNTSAVTNFSAFAYGCTGLTALDVSNWNTSAATNFSNFAYGCTSLTTVTVTGGTGNPFADSPCTNYAEAFTATNLTQASINAILVAINAAGTSTGTFKQSGGSPPSAPGHAAITAMRARGWTVAVTGGY